MALANIWTDYSSVSACSFLLGLSSLLSFLTREVIFHLIAFVDFLSQHWCSLYDTSIFSFILQI